RVEPLLAPSVREVRWEVAADPAFATTVASGTAPVDPASDRTVKVLAGGLEPDRSYWYRFEVPSGESSEVGRARTLPAAGSSVDRLRLAFASCQSYGAGWYTAWGQIAEADLDAVLFLGDYIYESALVAALGAVR